MIAEKQKGYGNLIGKRFGRLVLIEEVERIGHNRYFKCQCDCGTIKIVCGSSLKSGLTKSCGCLRKELAHKSYGKGFENFIGRRFGRLIVIDDAGTINRQHSFKCQCDCGTIKIIGGNQLKECKTKSCGCIQRGAFKDFIGKRFERLIVIEDAGMINHQHYFKCRCDCGTVTLVRGTYLKNKRYGTRSCGCLIKDMHKKGYGEATLNELIAGYKYQARKRGRPFELSRDDLLSLFNGNCYYCGDPPHTVWHSRYNNGDFVYNGIDRLDSSLGYIHGNVVSCCKDCNFQKGIQRSDLLLDWIKKVYEYRILEPITIKGC